MESLCDIDTYQDIVDRCAEFGNTDEFFAALYDMFDSTNINTTDSTIKTAVDLWYNNNILNYNSYIEDTIYCNDMFIC